MALKGRINIGSVVVSKDKERANYIQVRKDLKENIVLTPGQYITAESPQFQLENLERLVEKGILSADKAAEARTRIVEGIEKRKELGGGKDFVLADLFVTIK